MKEKSRYKLILIILIVFVFALNYSFIDSFLIEFLDSSESGVVERVIDGDTIKINGTSVRLLGINTPEKGEEYSEKATEFLKQRTLNKTVFLEFGKEKKDFYGRKLAYIILNNENINLEIVEKGLANPYFLKGKTKYYSEFFNKWEECVNENIKNSLCENSQDACKECLFVEQIDINKQEVIIKNDCSRKCNISKWSVKDEGRKNYVFPKNSFINSKSKINLIVDKTKEKQDVFGKDYYWHSSTYVWTRTGDTLFLRDSEGKLVLWENY
ncbi:MAG: thermonuclease family protein [Nanoarchaeota archaeon]